MLGKTKIDGALKGGAKLQAKNNKWYRYIVQVQLLVFAVMHLILGIYFAFVSSEYANHPGFTARIEDHRNMDQIFAIVCFVLFVLWLCLFMGVRKNKKISLLYYIGMVVSVVVPFVYLAMSDNYVIDAMKETIAAGYPELFVDGKGSVNEITFWAGFEFGMWQNGSEITSESQIVLDCLSKIGVESGAEIELAKFDMAGLVDHFRVVKYNWNTFELYAILNAVVSAAFVACTIIFVPLKQSKLAKLFKK